MQKILFTSIYLLACLLHTDAQVTFIKKYDYTQLDLPYSMAESSDGYLIMNNSVHVENEPPPPQILKFDKNGELIWTFNPLPANYLSDFPIIAHRCIIAPDSSILVCGRQTVNDSTGVVFVNKLSMNGDLIWQKLYKPYNWWHIESYWAEQIATWPNGDFVVTGVYYKVEPENTFYPDSMFLIKCNKNGEFIRETKINYPPKPGAGYEGGDSGNPVILPNGDVFYCFFASWDAHYHPILARFDSTLQLQWRKQADGVRGRSYELKMAADGNILMYVEGAYGNVEQIPFGSDPIVQKISPDGDSIWTYKPPGINTQQCYDMSTLQNGDIVFTGTPSDFEWLRCISPQGKYKWHRKFKPPDSRPYDRLQLTRVIGTAEGGILITGHYQTHADSIWQVLNDDIILIKLDSMGCLTPGCGIEQVFVGTKNPQGLSEEQITLLPNPATQEISLVYPSLAPGSDAQVSIFDLQGKLVKQLLILDISTTIDIRELASGVYFVKLRTANGLHESTRFFKQ
jgi:hypothetical protein